MVLEIERRLEIVVWLICTGQYSMLTQAERLGVSIPTASRCETSLRRREYDIRAEKWARGRRYFVRGVAVNRYANAAALPALSG